VRMLPLTDPRNSISGMISAGASGQPFPCQPLEYRETSSLTVPDGTNFYEKPAPVSYAADFSGSTPYGAVNGRIEVSGAATRDGRTLRSRALVRLSFDAPVCPAEFAAAIKTGLDRFTEFNHGPVGLTPHAAPYVTEISPDLERGENAFQAGNYQLAMARLKPLAEHGDARSQWHVARMHDYGQGVKQDIGKAIPWYVLAADQGDADSQSRLGYLYEKGIGVTRDDKRAAEWHAKAAAQGNAYSEACLATMYRDGRGVAQDFQQAAIWYEKSADHGYAWAQMNLGMLYAEGKGVPLDYTKAMFYFRNAADRNDSYAQYNLGWIYESGKGVVPDTQQAIEWYGKAADGGNALARARLDGLTKKKSTWGNLFRNGLFGKQ
jgi:TPR repeat protein